MNDGYHRLVKINSVILKQAMDVETVSVSLFKTAYIRVCVVCVCVCACVCVHRLVA